MQIKLKRTPNNNIAWNNANAGLVVTASQDVNNVDNFSVDFKANPHLVGLNPEWLTGTIAKTDCTVIEDQKPCLFDQWFNKTISGLGSFDNALFQLYILASGDNRQKLENAFPERFAGTTVLK